jgi:hypothetical protein
MPADDPDTPEKPDCELSWFDPPRLSVFNPLQSA